MVYVDQKNHTLLFNNTIGKVRLRVHPGAILSEQHLFSTFHKPDVYDNYTMHMHYHMHEVIAYYATYVE